MNPLKIIKVQVEKLRLRCYIGFNDWETKKMQDLVISYSFKHNAAREVISKVEHQKFALIETVAEIIWAYIKTNPYVFEVTVKVEKPHALRFCDNVLVEIDDQDRYNEAIICMGSNINPTENKEKTLTALARLGDINQQTDFIFTKALKYEDQPDFLNGAIILHTQLSYEKLTHQLKKIEKNLGRIRTENKNAPYMNSIF